MPVKVSISSKFPKFHAKKRLSFEFLVRIIRTSCHTGKKPFRNGQKFASHFWLHEKNA